MGDLMYRTHTCGELREHDSGKNVTLAGWVHSIRLHGSLAFLDLRDRYGITQITINTEDIPEVKSLRREFVIQVKGIVRKKPEPNKKLETGAIELFVEELTVLNTCEVIPLDLDNPLNNTDEIRLKYRYLDLRRQQMQYNIAFKHKVMRATREFLDSQNFLEIETPLLIRSTPEGARDYIVPSRVHPGKAYSLPQSPQIYKQILMVSGMDRYYQMARCLRDEDLRADRQPEFTQIDIEMSFPHQEDIFRIGEGIIHNVFEKTINYEIPLPFPRIRYDDAMEKYGCDKPDIRYGLFLKDITGMVKNSEFSIFNTIISENGIIKALCVEKEFTRKETDEFTEIVKTYKAKGLVILKVVSDEQSGHLKLDGSAAKHISTDIQMNLIRELDAKDKSTILIVADQFKICNDAMANIRKEVAKRMKLYDETSFAFCWVYDFPSFEWNPEEQKWDAAHHIFTSPKEEHLEYLESDPGKVRASCYDMVLNGIELASGSIRINRRDVQERVMNVIGLTIEDAEKKFGFLLESFKYGAPPHGGFAIGLDRLTALMCGTNDIREVIAFPKNKQGECPMDGCPTEVEDKVKRELRLKFDR
jgi:aspartyl-tRNA synthetase